MKKILTKTLIFISYFFITFFFRKIDHFSSNLDFLTPFLRDLIFWFLGALVGSHFLKLDQLFYVFFIQPDLPLSLEVKQLVKQRKIGLAWDLLEQRGQEQTKPALQSIMFQASWVILAFFALTSTTTFFGQALVMAIGLKLLLEQWQEILMGKDITTFFWQIKRPVSLTEQKGYLYLMTLLFGILTLLLI